MTATATVTVTATAVNFESPYCLLGLTAFVGLSTVIANQVDEAFKGY